MRLEGGGAPGRRSALARKLSKLKLAGARFHSFLSTRSCCCIATACHMVGLVRYEGLWMGVYEGAPLGACEGAPALDLRPRSGTGTGLEPPDILRSTSFFTNLHTSTTYSRYRTVPTLPVLPNVLFLRLQGGG